VGKVIVTLVVVLLLGGLAALGASVVASAASTKTVTLTDDVYTPKKLSVKKGTTVSWVWSSMNKDEHTVTQADKHYDPKDGGFGSKEQVTGKAFTHKFKKTGTFYIVCEVHPTDMRMKVTVR
jgi:plastocyanin